MLDITGRVAWIAGPGLVGLLLLVVPPWVLFTAHAATFAISAVALLVAARIAPVSAVIGSSPVPDRAADPVSARVLLRAHPAFVAAWLVHGVGFFLSAIPAIGMPLLLAHHLHVDASAYGLVLAASGVGAVLGNLVAVIPALIAAGPAQGFVLGGAVLAVVAAVVEVFGSS